MSSATLSNSVNALELNFNKWIILENSEKIGCDLMAQIADMDQRLHTTALTRLPVEEKATAEIASKFSDLRLAFTKRIVTKALSRNDADYKTATAIFTRGITLLSGKNASPELGLNMLQIKQALALKGISPPPVPSAVSPPGGPSLMNESEVDPKEPEKKLQASSSLRPTVPSSTPLHLPEAVKPSTPSVSLKPTIPPASTSSSSSSSSPSVKTTIGSPPLSPGQDKASLKIAHAYKQLKIEYKKLKNLKPTEKKACHAEMISKYRGFKKELAICQSMAHTDGQRQFIKKMEAKLKKFKAKLK